MAEQTRSMNGNGNGSKLFSQVKTWMQVGTQVVVVVGLFWNFHFSIGQLKIDIARQEVFYKEQTSRLEETRKEQLSRLEDKVLLNASIVGKFEYIDRMTSDMSADRKSMQIGYNKILEELAGIKVQIAEMSKRIDRLQ